MSWRSRPSGMKTTMMTHHSTSLKGSTVQQRTRRQVLPVGRARFPFSGRERYGDFGASAAIGGSGERFVYTGTGVRYYKKIKRFNMFYNSNSIYVYYGISIIIIIIKIL